MKKLLFLLLFLPALVSAESVVKIDFFYSPTCPHCAKEEVFLDDLQTRHPEITINRYSVTEAGNIDLLKEFYNNYNVSKEYYGMVPATFTNSKYFIGFNDDIAKNIEECIEECQINGGQGNVSIVNMEGGIKLPLIGEINIKDYSLPVLAVVLGSLDGFNVCSLGALVLILGLVLAMRSRRKTLIFGGLFILTTAVVYGLLIIIWYQIFFLLIPYARIMEVLIGLLGIGGAIYFFKQFLNFRKYGPTCGITPGQSLMSKFSSKFQNLMNNSGNLFLLIFFVFIFAAIITIIEFPCSAVVPVAFAGILAQSGLSTVSYMLYISVFIFFYMLDEIIVFLIAFFTMKIWLSSSNIVTWITLLEAIILLSLGIYYIL
jgi:thiol-disulfide isomerase/thioredoxin